MQSFFSMAHISRMIGSQGCKGPQEVAVRLILPSRQLHSNSHDGLWGRGRRFTPSAEGAWGLGAGKAQHPALQHCPGTSPALFREKQGLNAFLKINARPFFFFAPMPLWCSAHLGLSCPVRSPVSRVAYFLKFFLLFCGIQHSAPMSCPVWSIPKLPQNCLTILTPPFSHIVSWCLSSCVVVVCVCFPLRSGDWVWL